MASMHEDYEYHIQGKVDLSVLDNVKPSDVEKMTRGERFKVYSRLYHLFLHVSQEVDKYIYCEDMDDHRIEEIMEELPCITSESRDREESLMNHDVNTTEIQNLRYRLEHLENQAKNKQQSIDWKIKDVQNTKDNLIQYEKTLKEYQIEQEKIETDKLNVLQQIVEKMEEERKKSLP